MGEYHRRSEGGAAIQKLEKGSRVSKYAAIHRKYYGEVPSPFGGRAFDPKTGETIEAPVSYLWEGQQGPGGGYATYVAVSSKKSCDFREDLDGRPVLDEHIY